MLLWSTFQALRTSTNASTFVKLVVSGPRAAENEEDVAFWERALAACSGPKQTAGCSTQQRSRFVAWGCYVASRSGAAVAVSVASALGQKERQKVVTCAGWFEQGGGRGIQGAPPDLSQLTS